MVVSDYKIKKQKKEEKNEILRRSLQDDKELEHVCRMRYRSIIRG